MSYVWGKPKRYTHAPKICGDSCPFSFKLASKCIGVIPANLDVGSFYNRCWQLTSELV